MFRYSRYGFFDHFSFLLCHIVMFFARFVMLDTGLPLDSGGHGRGRGVGPHAAGVRPTVAFSHSFVILQAPTCLISSSSNKHLVGLSDCACPLNTHQTNGCIERVLSLSALLS